MVWSYMMVIRYGLGDGTLRDPRTHAWFADMILDDNRISGLKLPVWQPFPCTLWPRSHRSYQNARAQDFQGGGGRDLAQHPHRENG